MSGWREEGAKRWEKRGGGTADRKKKKKEGGERGSGDGRPAGRTSCPDQRGGTPRPLRPPAGGGRDAGAAALGREGHWRRGATARAGSGSALTKRTTRVPRPQPARAGRNTVGSEQRAHCRHSREQSGRGGSEGTWQGMPLPAARRDTVLTNSSSATLAHTKEKLACRPAGVLTPARAALDWAEVLLACHWRQYPEVPVVIAGLPMFPTGWLSTDDKCTKEHIRH